MTHLTIEDIYAALNVRMPVRVTINNATVDISDFKDHVEFISEMLSKLNDR